MVLILFSSLVSLSATTNSSSFKFIIIFVVKLACSNALSQCSTFSLTKLLNRVCTGIPVVPVHSEPLNIFRAILVMTSFIHSVVYMYICKKVKFSCYRPGVAQRVGRGIALLFHDRGTRRGEWSAACPGHTLPLGKTRYPLYRRLGWPQGWSGRAENLIPTRI